MALYPDYAALADLRTYTGGTSTADDAPLQFALTAASRAIDQATDRQFGVLTVAGARYYTPVWNQDLARWTARIDDLMTTTSLVVKTDLDWDGVYETTIVMNPGGTGGFRFRPYNAASDSRPWNQIVFGISVLFTQIVSRLEGSLEVTALWGWTAIPTTVEQATLLQASRWYRRKGTPFGVAGSPEMGTDMRFLRLDPDVEAMVLNYRHWSVG